MTKTKLVQYVYIITTNTCTCTVSSWELHLGRNEGQIDRRLELILEAPSRTRTDLDSQLFWTALRQSHSSMISGRSETTCYPSRRSCWRDHWLRLPPLPPSPIIPAPIYPFCSLYAKLSPSLSPSLLLALNPFCISVPLLKNEVSEWANTAIHQQENGQLMGIDSVVSETFSHKIFKGWI